MIKIAAIIGGVLLMAGVALAGTMTSLDSTNSPTTGTTVPASTGIVLQEDRGQENEQRGRRNEPGEVQGGRENEQRGRETEPGEDVRGPCDEPEHANDPRCTGAPAAGATGDDDATDDRGDDDSVQSSSGPGPSSGPSDRSGHDGSGDDDSGHGGDNEDNSSHGGGGDDD
jgi:transcription termination factor Rho